MEGVCNITQVQLLSHQCKISTKIELFSGTGPDVGSCRFERLGFLSLVDNAASDYKVCPDTEAGHFRPITLIFLVFDHYVSPLSLVVGKRVEKRLY